jgi:pyrroloquinoline quinone (PQQ) biosynthesis protein C
MEFVELLKKQVQEHSLWETPWLVQNGLPEKIRISDLLVWLSQEYHVSVSFVDWFLHAALLSPDQSAKIVLIENIWEELGEGDLGATHVSILTQFLLDLGLSTDKILFLPETGKYLEEMESIVKTSFFHALGALGPGNEYLLKLEYSKIKSLYDHLRNKKATDSDLASFSNLLELPEPKFFQVNLNADEGHAKRLFDLILGTADTESKQKAVIEGNLNALDARLYFYEGLFNHHSLTGFENVLELSK